MPSTLPPDEVMLEQAITAAMVTLLSSLDIPDPLYPKVYDRPRFPDTDVEEVDVSTIPDPVSAGLTRTHIIEIGIPTVREESYTGDTCTMLEFVYPINYELEVVDNWQTGQDGKAYLNEYSNSTALFKAVYQRARRAFKQNVTLGFNNCSHTYLQQVSAVTITDEEAGGSLHAADWSLTVKVTGVLV